LGLAFGLNNYNGVLLIGRQGNRQAVFAQTLANHFKYDLVVVNCQTIQHISPEQLREIMSKCIQLANFLGIVLFFPELNYLFESSLHFEFAEAIKNMRETKDLIIVAATSQTHNLNGLMSQYFDVTIPLDNPSAHDRKKFIQYFLNDPRFATDDLDMEIVIQQLEESYPNPNIEQIRLFCHDAKREAVFESKCEDGKIVMSHKHFQAPMREMEKENKVENLLPMNPMVFEKSR
jgi:SpoVK/Ycf46/Vps4 family AAA+-type ATPase